MAATNTDKFRKVSPQWTGTIGSAGVNDGVVTTIPLSSVSNIATDTAVMITVNRVTSLGAKTGNYEGMVGVISGNNLINCLRGVEGTAQAWVGGTVVEILATADNTNDLVDGILVEHSQLGVHTKATGATINTGTSITDFVTPKAIADSNLAVISKASAWTSFVPAWTNLTVGSGTNQGYYCQIGKTIHFRTGFTFAANSSISGSVTLTLPITIANYGNGLGGFIGTVRFISGGSIFVGNIIYLGGLVVSKSDATYVVSAALSSTVPGTWTTNDQIVINGTYEAA